jgi:hypothetical protein
LTANENIRAIVKYPGHSLHDYKKRMKRYKKRDSVETRVKNCTVSEEFYFFKFILYAWLGPAQGKSFLLHFFTGTLAT